MTLRVALCVVVLVALFPAHGVASGAIYDVDEAHELDTPAAINTYQQQEYVTGDVPGLNMTLTVADKAGDVGLTEWKTSSAGRVFLRMSYHEEIQRTVRVHIPEDYFDPRLKRGLESMGDNSITADVEPVENRTYTAVTVQFDGPTTVVFPLSSLRGGIASGRSWLSGLLGNATGVDLPSLTTGGAEWTTVPETELATNETVRINHHDPTIQYDADESPTEEQWVAVRQCDGSDQPVCRFTRQGQANTTYLLSTSTDPPTVRYRDGSSVTGTLGSTVNDAQHAVDELMSDVGSLFGSSGGD